MLTSHAFVHNLKRYAAEAEIDHVHLHQTRYTFARIMTEERGSFIQTQDALEHRNLSTGLGGDSRQRDYRCLLSIGLLGMYSAHRLSRLLLRRGEQPL